MKEDVDFDERIAARYDADSAEMFEPEVLGPTVDLLAELAGPGSALEFGIGTGRVALPLAARGVSIQGIDVSEAMVAQLREKPGGDRIHVTIGDIASAKVDRSFSLVYAVWNMIWNLKTQARQVACFRNAAAHLEPGGCFVVELGIPALRKLPPGESFVVFGAEEGYWGIDEYDVANQGLISHHLTIVDGKLERDSMPGRYVWPAELDLMAELAGMRLRDRWSSWKKEPFTSESDEHVSVWERPPD
jgi:SAM-dependent methyltransferase